MDSYLVRVDCISRAVKLLSSAGVRVTHIFPFISACGVSASEYAVKALGALPCVKSLHKNCRAAATASGGVKGQTKRSGKTLRINVPIIADDVKIDGERKEKITVAIIDTGVNEHIDLSLFPNKIIAFRDFIAGKETPYDDNGHGTAVAGVLCGSNLACGGYGRMDNYVKIAALKALDAAGDGNAFDLLTAMQWIYDNRNLYNIKAVNMSFGTPVGKNNPLEIGADALVKNGITVVVSAGNGGAEEGVLSPGTSPFVLTVGGADGAEPAYFSPFGGGKPDVLAQAVNVRTLGGASDYTHVGGTSMAAPKIAALAADILSKYPSYTPDRIKSLIISLAARGAEK